jgi:hypothetical protein
MSDTIPDFTDSELKLANQSLFERYGRLVALQLADAEIQLNPESEELATCPTLYWEERGAHFVILKLSASRFLGQFFYSETTQFGTGKDAFDNLGDCLITLLQVQSDHERQMQGISTGTTSLDAKSQDNYDGPLVI